MTTKSQSTTTKLEGSEPTLEPPKGDCGRRAFNAGLRYCGLPVIDRPLRYDDEIIAMARTYGLDVYNDRNKPYKSGDEPVLVIYYDGKTFTSDDYHAVFASDIAALMGRPMYAIIAGWDHLRARVSANGVPAVDHEAEIAIGKDWLLYKDAAERIVARIADNDCLTCGHWRGDAVYAIAVELATNVRAAAASPVAPARSVQHLVNQWQAAWVSTQDISRDSEADLVRRIETFLVAVPAPSAAIQNEADDLVDEVQHRMDQVVEAAVEWHQAGREGTEWFEAAEKLGAAINSLLELRDDERSKLNAAASSERCLSEGEA